MYFLRRQSNPNFHAQLMHPTLAHMLAQEEAMKCGSNKQRKMHCGTSPMSTRARTVEEKDHILIVRDLPGVKAEDLQVDFNTYHGYLHVRGQRTRGSATHYKFEHKFIIDEKAVDASNITVTLIDGVLEINVPKKMVTEEPRRVAVVAGAPTSMVDEKQHSHVRFTVDVPGIKINALKVEIDDDKISITGERVDNARGGASRVFNQTFALNTKRVDTRHLEAFLEDGVLTVHVPTKVPEKPRRIAVNGILVPLEEEDQTSPIDEVAEKEATENNIETEQEEECVDSSMNEEGATGDSKKEITEAKVDDSQDKEEGSGNTPSSSVASESEFEVIPETVVQDDE